jgi:hypothetical protein
MIDNKMLQTIYDEIDKFLPSNWEKLIVYLEYGKTSYSISFYIGLSGKYIKCYDLPDVTDDDLADTFYRIDKVVSKERNQDKEPWSNMTVVIDNNGRIHADLDYTDLLKDSYKYNKEWKKKYLA